jgi:CRP/FNR family transcriptional regulator, dissimilatory nitrate respiration regulator
MRSWAVFEIQLCLWRKDHKTYMIYIMSTPLYDLFIDGDTLAVQKDQLLFSIDDPVTHMHLLRSGTIDLVRHTEHGDRLILMRAQENQVLAEASAYSPQYHCDAIATTAATTKRVPVQQFLARLASDKLLGEAWAAMLAHQLQNARVNAEIRTLRSVSMRLDAWLMQFGKLPPKGQWQSVAQSLGVSKEALYRELAKRR